MGPKAENEALLLRLVERALREHAKARREYKRDDPPFASKEDLSSPLFQQTVGILEGRLKALTDHLRGSVPLASYRNQSHMYWDVTLPALVGYIAALPYNQNNVAAEASPVTTLLEMAVGDDLCRMLGYGGRAGDPLPWGHITCDGSVANAEALWASRNLKYLPVALAAALREDDAFAKARDVTARTHQGERRLLDLDAWGLLNLAVSEALGLPERAAAMSRLPGQASEEAVETLGTAVAERSVQQLGLVGMHRRYLPEILLEPAVIAPATAHYSWPKAAALLGLGRGALRQLNVDLEARAEASALRAVLDKCLKERRPVLAAVAVVGTTQESAVDPVAEFASIRDEFRERGLSFALLADAAWGGYFAAALRKPKEPAPVERSDLWPGTGTWKPQSGANEPLEENPVEPEEQLSPYVVAQYEALPRCDAITVDPHKAGFVPYPAGALCYRDGAMRHLVAFTAPVVYHGGVAPTVGVFGIEGSKPGAAAAAVWLSHSVIPADRSGYGRLLGQCAFVSKRFYAALLAAFGPDEGVFVTPLQRLPAERAGKTPEEVEAERERLAREVVPPQDTELRDKFKKDATLLELFRGLGSDQSIVTYAFNFRSGGVVNDDAERMNELNLAVFERLSVQTMGTDVPAAPAFVTASKFDPKDYGQGFVDAFADRAHVKPRPGLPIEFLISTQQNPSLTSTADGNFLPKLMEEMRAQVLAAAADVRKRHNLPD